MQADKGPGIDCEYNDARKSFFIPGTFVLSLEIDSGAGRSDESKATLQAPRRRSMIGRFTGLSEANLCREGRST